MNKIDTDTKISYKEKMEEEYGCVPEDLQIYIEYCALSV